MRVHGRHPLGAHLDAFVATGAVPDAGGFAQRPQPLHRNTLRVAVARVGGEAIRLGKGGRAQEGGVNFQHGAVGHARAAHDAAGNVGEVQHGFVGNDVLASGFLSQVLQVRVNCFDFFPEQVEIDHQVLDDGHHAGGFDGYDAVLHCVIDDGLAGEGGVAVDTHGAGTADGAAA